MAIAQLITASNCLSLLKLSTAGRSGSPNGNVFFNTTTGEIELITCEELAQIDLGSGFEDNPLTNYFGIMFIAIYKFENNVRETTEVLQRFLRFTDANFKFGGAYELVNGRKFASNDRQKIRGSGWNEKSATGTLDRIYFGVKSLNDIDIASQPYYQLAANSGAIPTAAPVDFNRAGPIDEAVQVYGSTAGGDSGAGNFDYTSYILVLSCRTFGNNYSRTTSTATGIVLLAGFSTGFGIGETANDQNDYNIADVYGGAAIAPWTGMSLEGYGTPQSRSGFNDGSANFTYILHNTAGGTLKQVRAILDALATVNADIDSGSGTIYGKRDAVWYSVDTQGRVVTRQGLHIDNLPASDQQSIVQTDNSGAGHTYPFNVEVRVAVGAVAVSDTHCWYRCMYVNGAGDADFNKVGAVTVNDVNSEAVAGYVSTDAQGNSEIVFTYDYDGNTQAGLPAGTNKDVVFICEGNGGATQSIAYFTIERQARVTASCVPGEETNV
jgi:hypothetical protein